MEWGHCPRLCDTFGGWNVQNAFRYNEILMDKWNRPWEPDVAEMVDAVFKKTHGQPYGSLDQFP